MKRPSLQFYPGDWLKDPELRSVSLAARGLWIDVLCLMHECSDRGYLRSASRSAITEIQLARMVGASPAVLRRLLSELESAGVFSRTEDGTIYSRRMVRDTELMDIRRQCGALGGNPNLVGGLVRAKVNQNGNQKPTPSSSSSSDKTPLAPKGAQGTSESERIQWFEEQFWPVVWAKIGIDAARKAWVRKVRDEATCTLVVEAAKRQGSAILERGKRPGSTVLHPATWLNQGRYLDEDPTSDAGAQSTMRLMA